MRSQEPARTRYGWRLLAAGTVTTVALTGQAPAATDPPAKIRAFEPVADTYVTASLPRANYGRAKVLRVNSSPVATTYLRFHLDKLTSNVASVILLLHTSRARRTSYEVRRVDEHRWREAGLTYSNAPRFSLRYASSKPVRQGIWSAVEVTSLVSGDEDISLAITTRGARELTFDSRESNRGPRLVVRVEDRDDVTGRIVQALLPH